MNTCNIEKEGTTFLAPRELTNVYTSAKAAL